jgi:hypothetical protein
MVSTNENRMKSALMKFLLEDYPRHRGKALEKVVPPRREEPHTTTFEIHDQKERIIQEAKQGVSMIRYSGHVQIEIIDFESYLKQYNEEGVLRCDFVIGPIAGDAFIVFNELTKSEGQYLVDKRQHATEQLKASIKRFYEDGENLLDGYKKKVVLFSFRPRSTEQPEEYLVAESKEKFGKPDETNEDLQESFPHGFIFEQRLYPTPYIIE